MKQPNTIKGIITTAQAAKELGVSSSRIRQMVLVLRAKGHALDSKIGNALVLSTKEYELIKQLRASQPPAKGGTKPKTK